MKNSLLLYLSLLTGAAIGLGSCNKSTTNEDDSISAQDATIVTNAMNQVADDAGASAGQVSYFTGKTEGLYQALCGVSAIDSSHPGQITLTYDGSSHCLGIVRSGTVSITLTNDSLWQDLGAQLTVGYNNLNVTDEASGTKLILNGSQIITNESGGLAWPIAYGLVVNDSAIHRNRSTSMTITFPNNAQMGWTVDRSRKWKCVPGGSGNLVTITDYSQATGSMDVIGTNRFGNNFNNTIVSPILSDNNASCVFLPYQGQAKHAVSNRTTIVTYGTNSSGAQQGSPTVCGSGFFIQYQDANSGVYLKRYVAY